MRTPIRNRPKLTTSHVGHSRVGRVCAAAARDVAAVIESLLLHIMDMILLYYMHLTKSVSLPVLSRGGTRSVEKVEKSQM